MLDNEIGTHTMNDRPMDPSEIASINEDEYSSISERDLDQMFSASPSPTLTQPPQPTIEELHLDTLPPAAAPESVHCPVCMKEFASKRSLAAHKRVHESSGDAAEKTFACSICSRKFARSSNLKKHMQHLHPETQSIQRLPVDDVPASDSTLADPAPEPQLSFSDFATDKPQLISDIGDIGENSYEPETEPLRHDHFTMDVSSSDASSIESNAFAPSQVPNVHEELIRLRAQNELLNNLLTSQMNQMFTFFSKK